MSIRRLPYLENKSSIETQVLGIADGEQGILKTMANSAEWDIQDVACPVKIVR